MEMNVMNSINGKRDEASQHHAKINARKNSNWRRFLHNAPRRLTSRAQARGIKMREPRSGTECAIPRRLAIYRSCLQRFVRLGMRAHFGNLLRLSIQKAKTTNAYPARNPTRSEYQPQCADGMVNNAGGQQ
jgi:hypothetical protein